MSEGTPCPDRILDDIGSAFAMGACGGSVWHGIKGFKNSPRGFRLKGAYQSVALRAPNIGGGFAVWGGLFASFDCLYSHLRRKEDPWNAIFSGASTGGVLALRAGWKAVAKNAFIGGALLGIIEGLSVMVGKMMPQEDAQMGGLPPPPGLQPAGPMGAPPPMQQRHTMGEVKTNYDPAFVFEDKDFLGDDLDLSGSDNSFEVGGDDGFGFNDSEDFDEEDW